MQRPPRAIDTPLLTSGILARIAVAGGFSAVAALWLMLTDDGSADHVRWVAYTALVCAQVVRAYANRSLHEPLHRLGTNWFLLGTAVFVLAIQLVIPLVPPLAEAFRASPIHPDDWVLIAVIALAPAVLGEIVKTARRALWVA